MIPVYLPHVNAQVGPAGQHATAQRTLGVARVHLEVFVERARVPVAPAARGAAERRRVRATTCRQPGTVRGQTSRRRGAHEGMEGRAGDGPGTG